MKKEKSSVRKFESLTDFHRVFGQPKPLHPMISLVDIKNSKILPDESFTSFTMNFYKIAYKTDLHGKSTAKYGQTHYDFGEGGLIFSAPNQLFETPRMGGKSGYALHVHPDFLLSYPLAKKNKTIRLFFLCL